MLFLIIHSISSEDDNKHFNFSTEITRENVLQYLNGKKTVIVHSYSSKCKHCTDFNPFWNDLVRLYYDKEDKILFSHVKCDLYRSVCSTYNFKTPGLTLFNDLYNKGFPLVPHRDLQKLIDSIAGETGIKPYAGPGCLLYLNEMQFNNIISSNKNIFIVVADTEQYTVNQTEIRKLEYETSLPIYAIRPGIESVDKLTCKGEYPCLGILGKNSFKRYTDSVDEDNIKAFISDFIITHNIDL